MIELDLESLKNVIKSEVQLNQYRFCHNNNNNKPVLKQLKYIIYVLLGYIMVATKLITTYERFMLVRGGGGGLAIPFNPLDQHLLQ